ncbi:phosphoribosyltransferase-like protein [Paenibacillus stellifer]|uniref:phosphoribosyltransferase-like protein n=1 Tax=Paenibacillus stellifer TaxID=169760 RepID=UPI0005700407|nr:hypothetical protein [Paenibacillus stellifer]
MSKITVMNQIPQIRDSICDKWEIGCSQERQNIENKIRAWIEPVQSDEIVDLLLELLQHFVYYDSYQVTKQFNKLYRHDLLSQFSSEEQLLLDSRFFPVTKDNRKTSSHEIYYSNFTMKLSKNVCLSDVFTFFEKQQWQLPEFENKIMAFDRAKRQKDKLLSLKTNTSDISDQKSIKKKIDKLKKQEYSLNAQIDEILEKFHLTQVSNYIFIDDMIGTGETMEKFLKKFVSSFPDNQFIKLTDITIYLIVLEACEEGVTRINAFCRNYNIRFCLIKNNDHQKAFKADHVYDATCCDNNKEKIRTFERSIIRSAYPLGYSESEALMAFYHNTPNNTLSSFWHEDSQWKGIFPRKKHLKPNSKEKKNAAKNVALERVRYLNS